MRFKVGDICRVQVGHEVCGNFTDSGCKFIRITDIQEGEYYYDMLDDELRRIRSCSECFTSDDLALYKPLSSKPYKFLEKRT